MRQEYFVSKPTTFMHLCPDAKSEVTDELLYGTEVFFDDESYGGFVFCKTDYGYSGYVDISDLSQKKGRGTKYVVTSPFCDFYEYPEYRFSPVMTLPKGSILDADESESPYEGFAGLKVCGNTYFVYGKNIKRLSILSQFDGDNKKRLQIVKTALSYLGTPYRWGGKSTFGIDCSGLCFMSYRLCGLALYRDAVFDRRYVRKISFDELKPADLIYYNGHITMYIGMNEYIHSSASLGGVKIGSFDEKSEDFYPRLSEDIVCCARSLYLN